jgi:cell division protein FtsZ
MGTGIAKGQNRARTAAEMAISSPLLDDITVDGATGVLLNIVGGLDLKMKEIQEAASLVQERAHEDANIIFGASIDDSMGESVKVTVIATGFDASERSAVIEGTAIRPVQVSHAGWAAQARTFGSNGPRHSDVVPVHRGCVGPLDTHGRETAVGGRVISRGSPLPDKSKSAGPPRTVQDTFPSLEHDWEVPAFQRKVPR